MSHKQELIAQLKQRLNKHQAQVDLLNETIRHVEKFYDDDMEPHEPYDVKIPVIHGTPVGMDGTIN